MSRVVHLNLDEGVVVIRCMSENVGVSVIEQLSSGGVRLVCMSSNGAAVIRRKLKSNLIKATSRARNTDQVTLFGRPTSLALVAKSSVQLRKTIP